MREPPIYAKSMGYICSLHFVGENVPSEKFPEPVKSESQQQNFKLLIGEKTRKSLEEKYNKKRILDGEELLINVESENVEEMEQKDYQNADSNIEVVEVQFDQNFGGLSANEEKELGNIYYPKFPMST